MSDMLTSPPELVCTTFHDALALELITQKVLGVQKGYDLDRPLDKEDMEILFNVSHGVAGLLRYSREYAEENLDTLEAMAREDMQKEFARRQNGAYDDAMGPGFLKDVDNTWNDGEESEM